MMVRPSPALARKVAESNWVTLLLAIMCYPVSVRTFGSFFTPGRRRHGVLRLEFAANEAKAPSQVLNK